jgi:thioredoxin-like negative regulator of GroEL
MTGREADIVERLNTAVSNKLTYLNRGTDVNHKELDHLRRVEFKAQAEILSEAADLIERLSQENADLKAAYEAARRRDGLNP